MFKRTSKQVRMCNAVTEEKWYLKLRTFHRTLNLTEHTGERGFVFSLFFSWKKYLIFWRGQRSLWEKNLLTGSLEKGRSIQELALMIPLIISWRTKHLRWNWYFIFHLKELKIHESFKSGNRWKFPHFVFVWIHDGGGCVGVGGGIGEIRVIKRSCCKVSSIILRLDLLERPLHNYLTSPIKRCPFLAP